MKNFLNNRMYVYLLGFAGILVCLFVITIKPVSILVLGEEVHLETRYYDPKDPFRGDFIRLGYVNERIPFELLDDEIDTRDIHESLDGKDLFVSLVKNGDYYEVEGVGLEKPEGLFIRAEFNWVDGYFDEDKNAYVEDSIMVDFNLDRLYIPENTGMALEEAVKNNEAYTVLKLFNGYGVVLDVRIK